MKRYHLILPEGPSHPIGADSLESLVRRALRAGMGFGHQGYYLDRNLHKNSLEWVAENTSVEVEEVPSWLDDVGEDYAVFVLWVPALTVESFETVEEADEEAALAETRGVRGVIFDDLDELKKHRNDLIINASTHHP